MTRFDSTQTWSDPLQLSLDDESVVTSLTESQRGITESEWRHQINEGVHLCLILSFYLYISFGVNFLLICVTNLAWFSKPTCT